MSESYNSFKRRLANDCINRLTPLSSNKTASGHKPECAKIEWDRSPCTCTHASPLIERNIPDVERSFRRWYHGHKCYHAMRGTMFDDCACATANVTAFREWPPYRSGHAQGRKDQRERDLEICKKEAAVCDSHAQAPSFGARIIGYVVAAIRKGDTDAQ